jgi:hypothetical protein
VFCFPLLVSRDVDVATGPEQCRDDTANEEADEEVKHFVSPDKVKKSKKLGRVEWFNSTTITCL